MCCSIQHCYYWLLQVRDVALLSNSLITVDLKSGSKVNIGTHTITLEKFFEGTFASLYDTRCVQSRAQIKCCNIRMFVCFSQ